MVPEGARIAPPVSLCSHGVRSVDPVGICQGCRDEAKPVCKSEGCAEAVYAGARGRLAGLCVQHFEDAFLDEEHRRSLQRDVYVVRDNAIANAYEAIDARGGA